MKFLLLVYLPAFVHISLAKRQKLKSGVHNQVIHIQGNTPQISDSRGLTFVTFLPHESTKVKCGEGSAIH